MADQMTERIQALAKNILKYISANVKENRDDAVQVFNADPEYIQGPNVPNVLRGRFKADFEADGYYQCFREAKIGGEFAAAHANQLVRELKHYLEGQKTMVPLCEPKDDGNTTHVSSDEEEGRGGRRKQYKLPPSYNDDEIKTS